ncbi:hypothetical protein [Jannaschia aquimarina]|uniref:Uncharacterized protein n=1 Tax=Jannaschia aquimarina TaxID=935700 RepID=A0A0D1EEV1_9RHOB|nr:hypothetical protein [Jannaschia aquimarina]KIT15416.1 hypothetical protein jaqu_28500 [Jannaschia aquimarina]SNT22643.1 hypothetical protein SAMN05421775_10864 [Jannaschia aquimarina]
MATLTFLRDERGALSVDWSVLTAGAVALAIAVMAVIKVGMSTQTSHYTNNVDKWRFGRMSAAHHGYNAYSREGFEAIMQTLNNLPSADVAALAGAWNEMMEGELIDDPSDDNEGFANDVQAALDAHYANEGSDRPDSVSADPNTALAVANAAEALSDAASQYNLTDTTVSYTFGGG